MTKPKARTSCASAAASASAQQSLTEQQRHSDAKQMQEEKGDTVLLEDCSLSLCMQGLRDASSEDDEDSPTPTPSDAGDHNLDEEDEVDSCSSFSLEECLNEFRSRRIRRFSTHSRDAVPLEECAPVAVTSAQKDSCVDPADEDLINQNRCNKEQERKCKPCKNGFCYCFTSDSGDGGGGCSAMGTARDQLRAGHVRSSRRHRKSESSQVSHLVPQRAPSNAKPKEKRRQSAPAYFKAPAQKPSTASTSTSQDQDQLTAISRLVTSTKDAPLIHIIQELHNNCVISEVRVNKDKIQAQQSSRENSARATAKSCFTSPSKAQDSSRYKQETKRSSPSKKSFNGQQHPAPSAPPMEKISEIESQFEELLLSTPLNCVSHSDESVRRRHKYGGRLLQKRVNSTQLQFKPRNVNQPPPKPPRSSMHFDQKSTVSSLNSTTPSVREAERILDAFLIKKGFQVVNDEGGQQRSVSTRTRKSVNSAGDKKAKEAANYDKRKSYPLMTQTEEKRQPAHALPTCPSLSDIQRVVASKKYSNYEKNIRHAQEKSVKELSFGWKEPKITDMLNYDTNGNRKEFKSQAVQAEPQSIGWHSSKGTGLKPQTTQIGVQTIGWAVPHKVDLDTVDGSERSNLASNISYKNTPVKTRLFGAQKSKASASQKFIWGEQLRNLSPWSGKKHNASAGGGGGGGRKSNLKVPSSRSFLKTSKKKILRLVSPKRDNKPSSSRKSPKQRTIGVQTSREDLLLYESSSMPQSPPGSYHSAVQTSHQSNSSPNTNSADTQFDFTRTVQSPPAPKKAPRSSQRKLNFPLNCGGASCVNTSATEDAIAAAMAADDCDGRPSTSTAGMTKTYRSFRSEFDQDVTLSKMGYILSNIRAKLEASDEHAIRTFQETKRRDESSHGFDCIDGPIIRSQTRVDVHPKVGRQVGPTELDDPIYSEIEEDSIHISSSPHFDNNTGFEHFPTGHNPEVVYAQVKKVPKSKGQVSPAKTTAPTPLGKILHDSLKNANPTAVFAPLPPPLTLPLPLPLPLPATLKPAISDVSYSSPAISIAHCQSLNNIRVSEQNSPPKRKNLSKSDLSLQRSEIFLENLCCSEIILEGGADIGGSVTDYLHKVDNHDLNQTYISLPDQNHNLSSALETTHDDSVSYEVPNDVDTDSNTAGSHLGLSTIAPPDSVNQSTPKKKPHPLPQTFMTKHHPDKDNAHAECNADKNMLHNASTNQSNSCPNTPRQPPATLDDQQFHTVSMNEMCSLSADNLSNNNNNESAPKHMNSTSLTRYKRLKDAFQRSFRKSKNFIKAETKRLSTSLNFPLQNPDTSDPSNNNNNQSEGHHYSTSSVFNLESLFALNEDTPIDLQIARAVGICRQLPDLEISPEMVEAERLLLFSTLRRQAKKQNLALVQMPSPKSPPTRRFFIDAMRLPVKADANQDLFFNYFYICTFECNGLIRSTQSMECRNHETIFRDCGIEFVCNDDWDIAHAAIQCQIFMLRLRKVSTLALEPHKPAAKLLAASHSSSSVSSSCEDIVSRFRLHATFTLKAHDFVPFEYVERESLNSGKICLRSARVCRIPLAPRTKSTNLNKQIEISGRADVRLPKRAHSGFLNVQDPHSLHNWNRRWCTLDGLRLCVWEDINDIKELPLLSLDLRDSLQCGPPIETASRELCARPRAFCLQCAISKADEHVAMAAVFFAADTLTDLTTWLENINAILQFISVWMK